MTALRIANIGGFPRIGDDKDHQRHRRALTNFQNKEISAHAFQDVQHSVIQETLLEQTECNLDEVTDGLISWNDPISHFALKFTHMAWGGLRRYFDTNTYYHVPVIDGRTSKKDDFVLTDFNFAKLNTQKVLRAVITGPLTLAVHTKSNIKTFEKLETKVKLFSEALAEESKKLIKNGCVSIQIDEPALGFMPEKWPLFKKGLQPIIDSAQTSHVSLALYFSPLASLYDKLRTLPVQSLILDFGTDGKKLLEKIMSTPPGPAIGWGLISGRNPRLEPIDPLLQILKNWADKYKPPLTYITPSCGLDHLPQSAALQKLKHLSKLRDESLAFFAPKPETLLV